MAKSKEQKKEILDGLKQKIDESKSIVFAEFNALQVKENNDLRRELKKEKSEYLVTKKTLLSLALKDKKLEGFDSKSSSGKLATIFGYEDEVAPAKILAKFMKENEDKIQFLGGVLEGKFLEAQEVSALAKLPSKSELYAKIVGSLNAPVSGFVNVLAGNLRGLVTVLKQIEEKKA